MLVDNSRNNLNNENVPSKNSGAKGRIGPQKPRPKDSPMLGTRFGNYKILSRIGKGGMGVVYKARQLSLNRTVALKVMKKRAAASELEIKMFRREAEALAT